MRSRWKRARIVQDKTPQIMGSGTQNTIYTGNYPFLILEMLRKNGRKGGKGLQAGKILSTLEIPVLQAPAFWDALGYLVGAGLIASEEYDALPQKKKKFHPAQVWRVA